MRLIPWEEERLQRLRGRRARAPASRRGVRLNHPEAVALIADAMLEAARAGAGYAEVEAAGRAAVDPGEVIDGVRGSSTRSAWRCSSATARGSSRSDPLGRGEPPDPFGPGALVIGDAADVVVNEGREAIELEVRSEARGAIRSPRTTRSSGRTSGSSSTGRRRGVPPRPAGGRVRRLGARRDEDRPARALRGHGVATRQAR